MLTKPERNYCVIMRKLSMEGTILKISDHLSNRSYSAKMVDEFEEPWRIRCQMDQANLARKTVKILKRRGDENWGGIVETIRVTSAVDDDWPIGALKVNRTYTGTLWRLEYLCWNPTGYNRISLASTTARYKRNNWLSRQAGGWKGISAWNSTGSSGFI